jgi:uncharacterized protein (TIGR02466 family)
MVSITPELSLIFPTPIVFRTVADAPILNAGLERAILARRNSDTGRRISNVGGWQSQLDLLSWPEPEIQRLLAELDQAVQQIGALPVYLKQRPPEMHSPIAYNAFGWANVNESGDYNGIHTHPGNQLSAVYYVAEGKPTLGRPVNGVLELRDPRPGLNFMENPGSLSSGSVIIPPKAGLLVVFPAFIEHLVHPFHGEGRRISIAINVCYEKAR